MLPLHNFGAVLIYFELMFGHFRPYVQCKLFKQLCCCFCGVPLRLLLWLRWIALLSCTIITLFTEIFDLVTTLHNTITCGKCCSSNFSLFLVSHPFHHQPFMCDFSEDVWVFLCKLCSYVPKYFFSMIAQEETEFLISYFLWIPQADKYPA